MKKNDNPIALIRDSGVLGNYWRLNSTLIATATECDEHEKQKHSNFHMNPQTLAFPENCLFARFNICQKERLSSELPREFIHIVNIVKVGSKVFFKICF